MNQIGQIAINGQQHRPSEAFYEQTLGLRKPPHSPVVATFKVFRASQCSEGRLGLWTQSERAGACRSS
jgi:hypothetical protein